MSVMALDGARPRLAQGVGARSARVAGGVVALLVLVAVLAGVIAPHDPRDVDLLGAFAGASGDHLLGTDGSGRDLLSRLLLGSRTALLGPVLVVAIAGAAGVGLGLAAAWSGGWRDVALMRALDAVLGVPGILLALVAVALFGRGLATAAVALGIAYMPYVGRVVRAETRRQRAMAYVEAAQAQGRSGVQILLGEILPNVRRSSPHSSRSPSATPPSTSRRSPSSGSGCSRRRRTGGRWSPRARPACSTGIRRRRCWPADASWRS